MTEQKSRLTATMEIREYLAKADPIMDVVIEKYGVIDYELHSDYLQALLSNIVGQQLSGKVADVIWRRFEALIVDEITACKVLALDTETMQNVGLSRNKAIYIKNIARAVADGSLTLNKFSRHVAERNGHKNG